jgi:ribosomal protein L3
VVKRHHFKGGRLLLVEGSVPGGPNSVVVIRKAVAAKVIKVPQVEPAKKKGKK